MRVDVARGSMPYSAVTQPLPEPRRNGGTWSSIDAVQITRVRPTSMSTEPSACTLKSGVICVGRMASASRPSRRVMCGYCPFRTHLSERREWRAQVDVARQRVDFLAVDENLHGGHVGQIDGERIDDRVDRENLVERTAGGIARDLRG